MAVLPTTGISTTLVGTTLGSGSRDVGALCTHPNINKWARFKPIASGKPFNLQESDFVDAKYGLEVETFSTLPLLTSSYLAGTAETAKYMWKPTGGVNSPYRLGDFRGYDSDSQPPFSVDIAQMQSIRELGDIVPISLDVISDPNGIKFGEILNPLQNYNFMVYAVKLGDESDQLKYITMETAQIDFMVAGKHTLNFEIDPLIFNPGIYRFGTSVHTDLETWEPGNHYIAFDNGMNETVTIESSPIEIIIATSAYSQGNPETYIMVDVSVTNRGTVDYFEIIGHMRYLESNIYDTPAPDEMKMTLTSNIAIVKDGTYTYGPSTWIGCPDVNRSCYVGVTVRRLSDNRMFSAKTIIRQV